MVLCLAPLRLKDSVIFSALATIFVLLLIMGEGHRQHGFRSPRSEFEYSTITGYFMQDNPETDALTFDYTKHNLGLINQAYDMDTDLHDQTGRTQWQRFERKVRQLNEASAKNVQYKVLFMGRHGQGYHNVAEAFYGTHDWDAYWSKLDGNGTITWADARLTDEGIAQARIAHDFWRSALEHGGIPAPESYYTSPLDRCCATANITFSDLEIPVDRPFTPTIKELLRETIGVHTCDRRSRASVIHSRYPSYAIPPNLTEDDELYSPDVRETDQETVIRVRKLLDDVFANDKNTWISFSSHSGAIGAILRAIGHRDFQLVTGAVIPVLVRAIKLEDGEKSVSTEVGVTPPVI